MAWLAYKKDIYEPEDAVALWNGVRSLSAEYLPVVYPGGPYHTTQLIDFKALYQTLFKKVRGINGCHWVRVRKVGSDILLEAKKRHTHPWQVIPSPRTDEELTRPRYLTHVPLSQAKLHDLKKQERPVDREFLSYCRG